MIIMGIDPSLSSTGVVVANDKLVEVAVVIKSDTSKDTYDRINEITERVFDIALSKEPDLIVVEGIAFASFGSATRDLAGLHYNLVCCLRLGFETPIDIVPPTTLKKRSTGNGKAKKQDMYKALPEHIKEYFNNLDLKKTKGLYDVVDAYWLTQWKET